MRRNYLWAHSILSAAFCLTLLSVCGALRGADSATPTLIGRKIENFELRDHGGKSYSLAELNDAKVVVVAFIGTECPLVKLYAPRLESLAAELAERGVVFLGIDANQQDSIAEMAAFARTQGVTFPLLKDVGNEIADRFGAVRTPEVYVLDAERVIRYQGRIDDQYGFDRGVGYQRPDVSRRDLVEAIEEVLAGKEVSIATTDAPGCHIGRVAKPKENSEVTYSNQIARIFQERCERCHRPGEIGPFALQSYVDTLGWGEMIREVVQEERMPPWGAAATHGEFKNESRLTDEEKQLIATWVENGCPEGDRSQLPPARTYTDGWSLSGEPDLVVKMADKPYTVPAEGVVEYQYFEVDPGLQEDVWVSEAEARPGNRSVVHHIIVFIRDPKVKGLGPGGFGPNDLMAGFAPGMDSTRTVNGAARLVKAGSKFVFQMHYTPNGKEQEDLSYLGLRFARPEEVTLSAKSGFAGNFNLKIPPGADNYEVTSKKKFRDDELLLSLMPHMHLRGKSFRYELVYPDGHREVLLDVPRYDFNWQLVYMLKEPKLMPKGSQLECTAHYDNSENNLANPDPTQLVTWGDQTWEEMMLGWYVSAKPVEHASSEESPREKPKVPAGGE